MNGRWAAGLAAFFSVGSLAWLPYGAKAGQTMIGQSTATGIAGDMNSRAGANGVAAGQRAVGVLSGSRGFQPINDDSQGSGAPQAPAQPRVVDPREIAARLADPSRLAEIQGQEFGLTGTVQRLMDLDGSLVVLVKPHQITGLSPNMVLMVKMAASDKDSVSVGQQVMLTGRLVSSKLNDDGVVEMLAFDQGQIMRTRDVPQAPSTPPQPTDPMQGWQLVGFAHMDKGGTGVFVRDGSVIYLHPGEQLEDGLMLTAVSADGVELSADGKKFELYAG